MKITDSVKEMLLGILGENPGKVIRVVFEGFGWGGPRLGLALEEPKGNEKSDRVDGLELLIDDTVRPYTEDQVVECIDTFGRKGLTISAGGGSACWHPVQCKGKEAGPW